jgi:hypothetical protein
MHEGLAFAVDGQLLYGSAVEYLSLVNYTLFVLAFVLLRIVMRNIRLPDTASRSLAIFASTWAFLEYVRWSYTIATTPHNSLLDPINFVGLAVLSVPLLWATRRLSLPQPVPSRK